MLAGMKAYSKDLRLKVLDALAKLERTEEVTEQPQLMAGLEAWNHAGGLLRT
jgi:hypothetical protein